MKNLPKLSTTDKDSKLQDELVVLRIIRPGKTYRGTGGDEITPANFQRRKLKSNEMEPGLSVSISGIISDIEVLKSFPKNGKIEGLGLELAECTIGELRKSGFEVIENPTHRNKAHAQIKCDPCDYKKIDCFPEDGSPCYLDEQEYQRDLADLFVHHPIAQEEENKEAEPQTPTSD